MRAPRAATPVHPPVCIKKAFASGSSETKAKNSTLRYHSVCRKLRPLGVRRVFGKPCAASAAGHFPKPAMQKTLLHIPASTRCTGLVTGPNRHLLTQALPPLGKDAPGRLSRAPSTASHHPAALCAQSKRAIRSHRCIYHFYDIVIYYIHPAAVCQIFFENCIAKMHRKCAEYAEVPPKIRRNSRTDKNCRVN